MIRLLTQEPEMTERPDVYSEMIRSLYAAYGTKYDFCRFYEQDSGAVISYYYGAGVLSYPEVMTDEDTDELSGFLSCGIMKKVLMPGKAAEILFPGNKIPELFLMRFSDEIKITDNIDKDAVKRQNSLSEIYEIVRDGFDIDRDTWYTDTSHILRRGIAGSYILDGSCAALKMFSSGGISYLSYICTRKSERGKGLAKRLIRYICAEETRCGREIFLFCEKDLAGFYEDSGFVKTDTAVQLCM